jgi:hypothetical protein
MKNYGVTLVRGICQGSDSSILQVVGKANSSKEFADEMQPLYPGWSIVWAGRVYKCPECHEWASLRSELSRHLPNGKLKRLCKDCAILIQPMLVHMDFEDEDENETDD